MKLSKNRQRIEATKKLLREDEWITVEYVAVTLPCGHGQAAHAIRIARAELADAGKSISYATARNGFTVAQDGDTNERADSIVTQVRYTTTRRISTARVAAPQTASTNPYERAIAKFAVADGKAAEADRLRLDAFVEAFS